MKEPSQNFNASDPSCNQTPSMTGGDSVRREAFAAARTSMGERSVPQLIELLASRDLRTRFLAEMSLRDATGT